MADFFCHIVAVNSTEIRKNTTREKNNDSSEKSEGMSPFPGVKQYFG